MILFRPLLLVIVEEIDSSVKENSNSDRIYDDDDLQNPVQVNQGLIRNDGIAWQALTGFHVQ